MPKDDPKTKCKAGYQRSFKPIIRAHACLATALQVIQETAASMDFVPRSGKISRSGEPKLVIDDTPTHKAQNQAGEQHALGHTRRQHH